MAKAVVKAKDVLAVAFTDLNGNHEFDPNKDALIAAVIDTDKSGTVTPGVDIVMFGTYPHLDGTQAGSYQHDDSVIASIVTHTSTLLEVTVADPVVDGTISWQADPALERFHTQITPNAPESVFQDTISTLLLSEDIAFATRILDGPGLPNNPIAELTLPGAQPGDQPFVDIFIA